MKYWIIIFGLGYYNAGGQTLREWTAQKETALQYSQEQLSILGEGLSGIREGYNLAKKGLRNWNHLAGGERAAHKEHFKKMTAGSPLSVPFVKEVEGVRNLLQEVRRSSLFTSVHFSPTEKSYMRSVCTGMEAFAFGLQKEWESLQEEDALSMTQGEREQRATELQRRAEAIKGDAALFYRSYQALMLQREKGRKEKKTTSKL